MTGRRDRIFRPHTMQGKVITNKMTGTGMGSVLLDKGGAGSGSSYYSMDDYLATTGGRVRPMGGAMRPRPVGLGIGGAIEDKLQKLSVRPAEAPRRKAQNIKFSI